MSIQIQKPMYNTQYLTDIFPDVTSFLDDYKNNGLPTLLSDKSVATIYLLLLGRWATTPIANMSEDYFKMKLFSIVFTHGPSWEKRLEIQEKIRGLSEEDIVKGSKIIYNNAENPSTTPSTGALDELSYIDRQSVNKSIRGKPEAYALLWDLIKTDVTTEFINRFKVCFKQFVKPERPLLYVEEDEE